jgi:hypothetical protein
LLKGGIAHWHNILRGSAKPPTSTGESILLRYIEKGLQYIWRRRITSTLLYSQLSHTAVAAAAMAARLLPLQLSLSLNSHSRFLSFLLSLCFSNVGLYL